VSERLAAARRRGLDRALAESIAGFEECATALPTRQRRVLTLRAGLDGRRARTRAETARILGLSAAAVGRRERQAVAGLWALHRRLGCGFGRQVPGARAPGGVAWPASGRHAPATASTGFVYDLLRLRSGPSVSPPGAGGVPSGMPVLAERPFPEVAVADPAAAAALPSRPAPGGLQAWLDRPLALLAAALALVLAMLAAIALWRAVRDYRVSTRQRADLAAGAGAAETRRLLGR
jgi:hypothetical protein